MRAGERKLWSNSGLAATTCRLLLVRHATAEGNGRFQGRLDVPLSSAGRRELRLLCEKCSRYPVRAVYSSDLRRARQTADAIARNLGLDVDIRPELREINFGQWEGSHGIKSPRAFPSWLLYGSSGFRARRSPAASPSASSSSVLPRGYERSSQRIRGDALLSSPMPGSFASLWEKPWACPRETCFDWHRILARLTSSTTWKRE